MWCEGCCSRPVVVIKLRRTSALRRNITRNIVNIAHQLDCTRALFHACSLAPEHSFLACALTANSSFRIRRVVRKLRTCRERRNAAVPVVWEQTRACSLGANTRPQPEHVVPQIWLNQLPRISENSAPGRRTGRLAAPKAAHVTDVFVSYFAGCLRGAALGRSLATRRAASRAIWGRRPAPRAFGRNVCFAPRAPVSC